MKKDNHQAINRRDFLKIVGISTATTAPLLSGCSSDSGWPQVREAPPLFPRTE